MSGSNGTLAAPPMEMLDYRAWRGSATAMAEWTFSHLVNRTDVWGGYRRPEHRDAGRTITKPAVIYRGERFLDDRILAKHFRAISLGDIAGLHTTSTENTCRWIVVEVDQHGDDDNHETAEKNIAFVQHVFIKLTSLGFSPWLIDSNGAGGFHVWVIFNTPIPSAHAYRFGRWITGDYAEFGLKDRPESFPKQLAISPEKFGNWVRLPGHHHTRDAWARFWNGMEWVSGTDAVNIILTTAGDDPAMIPAEAIAEPPAPAPLPAKPRKATADTADRLSEAEIAGRCLDHIPNADLHYDVWLSIGGACHSIGARELFWEWSRRSSKHDDAKTESTWGSFHRTGVGRDVANIGTLVYQAKQAGYDVYAERTKELREKHEREKKAAAIEAPATDKPDELSPSDPLPIARKFRQRFYTHPDGYTLLCDQFSTFHKWQAGHYAEMRESELRAGLYPWLEKAKKWVKRGDDMQLVPFAPTAANVNNIIDAAQAECFEPAVAPCWLSAEPRLPDPKEIIAASNGLVWLKRNAAPTLFCEATPKFYSLNCLDFPFTANAPTPLEWLKFLDMLWAHDPESIQLLQEWFGYCLTGDTRQQKALLLVGPKRAGKGTIARVLTRLIGIANVCGPTLSGLSTNFGLWALIGKLLAIVSDARLSNRTDQATITERILAIAGEDSITIDRKNLEPVTMRLLVRLMILTNELPKLDDASGALASRFLVLTLSESFYGREDTGLEDRICAELPGILLWAIEGWQRLNQRGHFIQPASSEASIEELNDLASPIGVFVRDWCDVRPGVSTPVADLFEAWQFWCAEQGTTHAGTKATFGRDLRAAIPRISVSQPRVGGVQIRVYNGVELTISAVQTVSIERGKRQWKGVSDTR